MSSTGPKQAIYENLAEVAQALGHPHRLELLEHLAQGVRSVEELSARAHLTFANTSRHLQILRRARLVETEGVRPEDEFALGHLPGALNIPLAELERRLGELPKSREVIAYCRGPYCVLSFEAVAALRARGYRVRRLEDGYPEWKAAGLPVEAVA